MVGHIVAALRQSPLVRDLEVSEMIDEANVQLLRVRAELIDGSLLRWDNALHHPAMPTHPHHKHDGERIGPAARVSIEDVLAELATRLQSR